MCICFKPSRLKKVQKNKYSLKEKVHVDTHSTSWLIVILKILTRKKDNVVLNYFEFWADLNSLISAAEMDHLICTV